MRKHCCLYIFSKTFSYNLLSVFYLPSSFLCRLHRTINHIIPYFSSFYISAAKNWFDVFFFSFLFRPCWFVWRKETGRQGFFYIPSIARRPNRKRTKNQRSGGDERKEDWTFRRRESRMRISYRLEDFFIQQQNVYIQEQHRNVILYK